jgi:hypothetical protein
MINFCAVAFGEMVTDSNIGTDDFLSKITVLELPEFADWAVDCVIDCVMDCAVAMGGCRKPVPAVIVVNKQDK